MEAQRHQGLHHLLPARSALPLRRWHLGEFLHEAPLLLTTVLMHFLGYTDLIEQTLLAHVPVNAKMNMITPDCYSDVFDSNLDNDAEILASAFVRETLLDFCDDITKLDFTYVPQSPPGGGGEGLSTRCPVPLQRSCVPQGNTCSLPEGYAHAVLPVRPILALHSRLYFV